MDDKQAHDSEGNWTGWLTVGQFVLFIAAGALLVVHTLASELATNHHLFLTVDWLSLALLGSMGVALMLWHIKSLIFGSKGIEVRTDLEDRAGEALAKAQQVAGSAAANERTPALEDATVDPLRSLELSRRSLSEALRHLAEARSLLRPATSLDTLAGQLREGGVIDESARQSVAELADTFRRARRAGEVSPALALEVDYATQLLVGHFRQLAAAVTTFGQ